MEGMVGFGMYGGMVCSTETQGEGLTRAAQHARQL